MKHARVQSGSMVLSCIFFISIFTLIMVMQWRSQEILQNVMAMRIECIKKQYAAEALLQYGIEVCKKQYGLIADTITKRKAPLSLTFNRWPLGCDGFLRGTIEVSYNKLFTITATLSDDTHKQISYSCCLEKTTVANKDVFTITAWKRNET